MITKEMADGWRYRLARLVLIVVAGAITLIVPAQGTAEEHGMTLVGEVRVLPIGDIFRRPASFFDLEDKTVTFTPDGAGGYTVRTGELTWFETTTVPKQTLNHWKQSTEISLPFAFPFAGQTWTRVHANRNGNVSFAAPETTHWKQRSSWSNGTMRAVAAAVDSRSAAGLEAMIAVLWALYRDTAVSVASSPTRVAITWKAAVRIDAYEPVGPNEFQVRLYPSGSVELAYRKVSERDGIVGLFHGAGAHGDALSAATDESGDVPHTFLDIVSAQLVDNGSTVIASVTMADDIPAQISSGHVTYGFSLGSVCRVNVHVRTMGRRGTSWGCGPDPTVVGYTVQGRTLKILISKLRIPEGLLSWRVTAIWWGKHGFDRLDGPPVNVVEPNQDLSSMTETVTGNIFEVFHYPAILKKTEQVMSSIYGRVPADTNASYGRVPADEHLIAWFTDFRFDDLHNSGPGTGPINVPVLGIGEWRANPRSWQEHGSDIALSAVSNPQFIGTPKYAESGVYFGREFHGHALGVHYIAHELIHRWAANMSFKDPTSGRIEKFTVSGGHWGRQIHTPTRHPVWRSFLNRPYSATSVMGGGLWEDNGDGTFTNKRSGGYLGDLGLSDLDLYVMGMIPPEEVRPTFLLRNVVETGTRGVVRATKVTVRIEDIVAAMGPRVPSANGQQKVFKLGFYLLHQDGQVPRADLLVRTRNLARALIEYFKLATTGSADANRPVVPVKWY